MKKIITIGFVIFVNSIILSASPINYIRETGPYIQLSTGIGLPMTVDGTVNALGVSVPYEAESKVSYGGGVGVGYAFSNNTRLTLSYAYTSVEVETVKIGNLTIPGNGESNSGHGFGLTYSYDLFVTDMVFIPFSVGVALGYSEGDVGGNSQSVWSYGGGLGTGIGLQFTPNIAMVLGYGFGIAQSQSVSFNMPGLGNFEIDPDLSLSHTIGVSMMFFF